MAKHLTDLELERYRSRTLPPQALLAANSHLYDCESCHGRYGGDGKLEAAFAFVRSIRESDEEESHLPFEQLAKYVDDALEGEERRMAEAHLERCALCEAQVRELRPLRDLIAHVPEVAVPAPTSLKRPTLFGKLRAAWLAPPYRTAALPLGVALLVVLLGWFLERSLRTDVAVPQTQGPQTPQAHGPIEQKAVAAPPGVEGSDTRGAQVQTDQDASADGNSVPVGPQPSSETAPVLHQLRDADASVTLFEGGRVEGLNSLHPADRQLVGRVLMTARVETPRMPWQGGRGSDVLMGGAGRPGSFSLLSPVSKVVRSVRPSFRWTAIEGGESYVVTIKDSRARTVAMSGPLSATEWSVSQPLRPGVVYSWKVLAVKDGEEVVSPPPTAPDARFKVLEESPAAELIRAEQLQPRSHLLLGALYARAGLLDEAEREFQRLVENNPRSRVARELLRDLKSRRR